MQEISIESNVNVLEFINRLRALTTNNVNETTLVGGRKCTSIYLEELI
jgi:hypothetical protein